MSFNDGDLVVLNKPGHIWHMCTFYAYKSPYTLDAYRIKYGDRELLVDISEIRPAKEANALTNKEFGLPTDFEFGENVQSVKIDDDDYETY